MTKQIRIESIKLVKDIDNNPDTSYLGEYTDTLSDNCIVRQYSEYFCKLTTKQKNELYERSNKYRYFEPYASGEKQGTKLFYRYGKLDFKRMERLNDEYWNYISIGFKADIYINDVRQTISSGFLYGIESDSRPSYINFIIKEQKTELIEQLKTIGFSMRSIKQAFKEME